MLIDVLIFECPVCGTEFYDGEPYCEYCGWCLAYEAYPIENRNEDEYDSVNGMTLRQAKKLLAQGLDTNNDPLPKVKPGKKTPKWVEYH